MLRLSAMFGRQVDAIKNRVFEAGERIGGAVWADLVQSAQDAVEDTLWRSYSLATFGLDAMPQLLRPRQPRNNALHRLATTASGVASGFVGLPGVVFDIPFTTATILRSIAEVARDSGENLADEETRRACLEVLALGGPGRADDEAEIGYWATRIGVNHLTVNLLIRAAAGRFGLVLSEKFLAQAGAGGRGGGRRRVELCVHRLLPDHGARAFLPARAGAAHRRSRRAQRLLHTDGARGAEPPPLQAARYRRQRCFCRPR